MIVGADIPDDAARYVEGGFEHFDQGEMGLAKAATGDEDAEAGLAGKHLPLAWMQGHGQGVERWAHR